MQCQSRSTRVLNLAVRKITYLLCWRSPCSVWALIYTMTPHSFKRSWRRNYTLGWLRISRRPHVCISCGLMAVPASINAVVIFDGCRTTTTTWNVVVFQCSTLILRVVTAKIFLVRLSLVIVASLPSDYRLILCRSWMWAVQIFSWSSWNASRWRGRRNRNEN